LGIIINRLASYPRLNNASFSDIFSLTDNPCSHPLPAIPVRLRGELIAQGKNFFLKDSTGIIPLAPNYRFGFWHKIRTTNPPMAAINNTSVQVLGWFRRFLLGTSHSILTIVIDSQPFYSTPYFPNRLAPLSDSLPHYCPKY